MRDARRWSTMKYIYLFILIFAASCTSNHSIIKDHVVITIYTYEYEGKVQASAMPDLRFDSELNAYKRRFEYLLINNSEIHLPEKAERRKEIWDLYPDTSNLRKLYLQEYIKDEKLTNYLETTKLAITDSEFDAQLVFTEEELMEVASRFFYCDMVFPDTTVQSHVCVGLNGVDEAIWDKDYTLLEAFCYEAIFDDLIEDDSEIDKSYSLEKKKACDKFKPTITSLDQYLLDVRIDLFARMKKDPALKKALLEYYDQNKNNLTFQLIN